jgi:hypothetical protein
LEPIRILLVDLPAILHDIVRDVLVRARGILVVGDVTDPAQPLGPEIERTGAVVVVVGSDHPELTGCRVPVFPGHPDLRLVTLTADGSEATLYEMRPHMTRLGELSPEGLAEVLRSAGARRAAGRHGTSTQAAQR